MTDDKRPRQDFGRVDYTRSDWPEQERKREQKRKSARNATTLRYRKKRKAKLLTIDQEPVRFEEGTGELDVWRMDFTQRRPVGPFRTYRGKKSVEAAFALHRAQGGRCAICGTIINPVGRSRAVDHDWKTGKVRGMLCKPCNLGLGMFKDDPRVFVAALKYLGFTYAEILDGLRRAGLDTSPAT